MRLRNHDLRWGERTYIMGVVNVTPDSFSGDGLEDAQLATQHAIHQAQRADIVDIGAESTRPGHTPVDEATEMRRLLPVVRAVRDALPDAVLSIDTYKKAVFASAYELGADMVNSIWGMPDDLLEYAAAAGVPMTIMHNQRTTQYEGEVMDEVLRFLSEAAQRALRAGLSREQIILDPGIGFGKTPDQNISVLRDLARLPALGFPTMIGTSRKSTIGKLTGKPPAERVFGTTATTALAIAAGIDIVRVHDVEAARDAARVSDAIVRNWRPEQWT